MTSYWTLSRPERECVYDVCGYDAGAEPISMCTSRTLSCTAVLVVVQCCDQGGNRRRSSAVHGRQNVRSQASGNDKPPATASPSAGGPYLCNPVCSCAVGVCRGSMQTAYAALINHQRCTVQELDEDFAAILSLPTPGQLPAYAAKGSGASMQQHGLSSCCVVKLSKLPCPVPSANCQ